MLGSLNQPTPSNSSTQPHPHPQSHPAPLNRYPPLFLAVDGGGSGVRAVIASHAGVELARARQVHAIKSVTAPVAVTRILQAVNAALTLVPLPVTRLARVRKQSSLMGHCFAKAWVGVAGVDSRTQGSDFEDLLRQALHFMCVFASDGHLFAAASTSLPHVDATVVMCAGTGSVSLAFRIHPTTREPKLVACRGGWGPVLGDEGSAYSIGRLGIRSVLSYFDELYMGVRRQGPNTAKNTSNLSDVWGYITLLWSHHLRRSDRPHLFGLFDASSFPRNGVTAQNLDRRSARIVLEHAFPAIVECVESKRTALGILAEAQAHLIDVVLLFVDQLRLDLHRTVLTLGGSLWTKFRICADVSGEARGDTMCVQACHHCVGCRRTRSSISCATFEANGGRPNTEADELELHNKIR
ncbi:BQ5605_C074g12905 [Microbotryum silenes-dioicae]|uniref:BQ5605_C074g12905 protein n=1 Tax=Microbotryum silenes-dioicae TaxID=796604 RepID=A0A2X0MRD3_9BASI|nr:BQ5605_C074g12905 [Microbotryum silenes-dioicae]